MGAFAGTRALLCSWPLIMKGGVFLLSHIIRVQYPIYISKSFNFRHFRQFRSLLSAVPLEDLAFVR